MIKTLTIEDKEIRLDNNVGWAMIYKDQFGTDIIPALMPLFAGAMDVISELIQKVGNNKEIDVAELLAEIDGDALINAVIHLSGFEFVDFINIVWALAKNADDTIPEPKLWVKQFDVFPLDEIAPEVFKLVAKGVISSKNMERLSDLKITARKKKSTSTRSSSQA